MIIRLYNSETTFWTYIASWTYLHYLVDEEERYQVLPFANCNRIFYRFCGMDITRGSVSSTLMSFYLVINEWLKPVRIIFLQKAFKTYLTTTNWNWEAYLRYYTTYKTTNLNPNINAMTTKENPEISEFIMLLVLYPI